ncbi:MAG: ROK family protein, partial [Acidobacteriaceae bacterium]
MRVLGIDCGGSHLSCALIDDKKLLAHASLETAATSLREILPLLASTLRDLCRSCSVSVQSCSGLGIGLPVILEARTGAVLSTLNKYCDLPQIDLAAWSERELGLPIRFENDARMALLGEQFAGAAVGAQDVVMITLGTGIGAAAMLQGRLLHSRYGQAGCLGGHLTVNFRGRRCKCGAIGCAEAEASTAALADICREWPDFDRSTLANEGDLNFETLFRCKDAGDAVADEVLHHCLEVWSALTVSLIHAYGPELVLFGGAVMRRDAEILEPIRRYVATHMWRTIHGPPRIEAATLGSHAALFGA